MSNESLWLLPTISLSVGDSVATFSDGRQHSQIDGHGKEIVTLCTCLADDYRHTRDGDRRSLVLTTASRGTE